MKHLLKTWVVGNNYTFLMTSIIDYDSIKKAYTGGNIVDNKDYLLPVKLESIKMYHKNNSLSPANVTIDIELLNTLNVIKEDIEKTKVVVSGEDITLNFDLPF